MFLLHPLLGLDGELAFLVWNDAIVMDAILVTAVGGKGREGGRDREREREESTV